MNKWIIIIILIIIAVVVYFVLAEEKYITFENTSQYDIASGVLVYHDDSFTMNFIGGLVPDEFESLIELGDAKTAIEYLEAKNGVLSVVKTPYLNPGDVFYSGEKFDTLNLRVSFMAMIVQTNDTVVFMNNLPVYNPDGTLRTTSDNVEILDMGIEQNSPIGSGFNGGQPDSSRGADNINNGTTLREPVSHSKQFYDDLNISTAVGSFSVVSQE